MWNSVHEQEYVHIQIPLTGYVSLIWHSTTEALQIRELLRVLLGYTAGTLTGVPCMQYLQHSFKVPSKVLQLAVSSVVLRLMRQTYVASQEESGCVFADLNNKRWDNLLILLKLSHIACTNLLLEFHVPGKWISQSCQQNVIVSYSSIWHNSGIPYTPYNFRVRITVRIRIRVRVKVKVRVRVRIRVRD